MPDATDLTAAAGGWGELRRWKPLYRFGAWAAIAVVALVPIQAAIYILWPPPTTVSGYFSTFHDNPVIGLLNQDLLLLVDEVLMLVVTLGLYVALRRASPPWMAIALVGVVVGTALFLASNTAFDLFNLSSKYAAATTEQQRTAYLAAGEASLAGYQGSAYFVGYFLTGACDLVIALVMFSSPIFGRVAAWIGVVYAVPALVPPVPATGSFGLVCSFVSLVPMIVWLVLIARGLFRLSRPRDAATAHVPATVQRTLA
jgi:hypothetical protein